MTRCLSRTKGGILMIRFRNPVSDIMNKQDNPYACIWGELPFL